MINSIWVKQEFGFNMCLGLTKPTQSRDSILNSHLFNQESLSGWWSIQFGSSKISVSMCVQAWRNQPNQEI